jgi:hypothetical protein
LDTVVVFIENKNKHMRLVHSLNLLGVPFVRLFEGQEWISHFNKIQIYIDGLKDIKNEWVLLSDSRDVLFYKDIEEINAIYRTYFADVDIVVQAEDTEQGCTFFQKTKLTRYSFGTSWYKYPCSGLIMGKRLSIINLFEEILEKVPVEWAVADQPALEWGMANLPRHKVKLDTECRVFQQMGMGNYSGVNFHLHFNKNFIKNTYTNTEPCIFHGAGNTFLHPVWRIINKIY